MALTRSTRTMALTWPLCIVCRCVLCVRCEVAEIFWSTIYKLGRRLKKMMRSRKHATLEGFVWLANRAADVRTQLHSFMCA
jgi:hypothetical protein